MTKKEENISEGVKFSTYTLYGYIPGAVCPSHIYECNTFSDVIDRLKMLCEPTSGVSKVEIRLPDNRDRTDPHFGPEEPMALCEEVVIKTHALDE